MKTIVLGDTHGRDTWMKIASDNKDAERFIFIGDYFDSRDGISTDDQINNFLNIIEFKKLQEREDKEVVLLIGNHDHHYFKEIGYTGTSGYQAAAKFDIERLIDGFKNDLQMAYSIDNILFTHAGVSEEFMDDEFGSIGYEWISDVNTAEYVAQGVNNLWKERPKAFLFNGIDGSGNDTWQTPIWIRPQSLVQSSKNLAKKGIIQVVGHTQVKHIDPKGIMNQGKYYLIDTIGIGEYLIIEDDKFSVGKVKI